VQAPGKPTHPRDLANIAGLPPGQHKVTISLVDPNLSGSAINRDPSCPADQQIQSCVSGLWCSPAPERDRPPSRSGETGNCMGPQKPCSA